MKRGLRIYTYTASAWHFFISHRRHTGRIYSDIKEWAIVKRIGWRGQRRWANGEEQA